MAKQDVIIQKLSNGLTLVAEKMPHVSSASFSIMVPAGSAGDPHGLTGTASVVAEWISRGNKHLDNRSFNDKLDSLGLQRHNSTGTLHSMFSGALLGDKLPESLKLYADMLRSPRLETEHFELSRDLALQHLESLEDDPRQKILMLTKNKFLPSPWGRPAVGVRSELEDLTAQLAQSHYQQSITPDKTILAAAGSVDFENLIKLVDELFGDWTGPAAPEFTPADTIHQTCHHAHQGAQVHIGVMYPSVNRCHEDYYKALLAVLVLSGGMGSRLFTEVREKRGLCYAVSANHSVLGPYGLVQAYLGSSPDKAQEGLDVMLGEFRKLSDGITPNELDRAKVGLRASLVMQGESTPARSSACASDYYYLGRVRSLTEIEQDIQQITVDQVVEHVKKYEPKDFTVVTIGPRRVTG